MLTAQDLKRVEVHLGTRCNNRCAFCMSADRRDQHEAWSPVQKVRGEIRRYFARGCRALGFLGGEPTVYPHILDCLRTARDLGYTRIALCTNGTRLSNPDFCREVVAAGVTRVAISVHSHRQDVEDKITGVPGNFQSKTAAIRNLLALRKRGLLPDGVSLNPVLSRRTCRETEAYVRFYMGLGIRDIRFNFIWPQAYVIADPAWIPTFREAVPGTARLLLLNEKRLRIRLTFGGMPKCVLALTPLSERLRRYLADKYLEEETYDPPNAVVAPGREGEAAKRFIWQEAKRNQYKRHVRACACCRHAATCEGVWKTYLSLHGGREFQAVR
jgi:MoaA/NifB/PqqE/SkfB family radical SAM enzyme